jgi:glycosyltransferase involved in cell wall biosynthesis
MNVEKIVIFGASGGGVRVAETLLSIKRDFIYFVDNDKNKWGQCINGKSIFSPEKLLEEGENLKIIIASEYQQEIEKQLFKMGLSEYRVEKEAYIIKYINEHLKEFDNIELNETSKNSSTKIFIELLEGIKLGGIETWALTVAKGLIECKQDVVLLSIETDEEKPMELTNYIVDTKATYSDYWGTIHRVVDIMLHHLPCSIIINKQSQALYAAHIIKQFFPNMIKIISVVHNDTIANYRKHKVLIDIVDIVACVSSDIKERLIKDFQLPENKVFYKESAVEFYPSNRKQYTINNLEPIKIIFAARITKTQKRADLLIPLIDGLEQEGVNYNLTIAGDGNYLNVIEDYINGKHLKDKVKLLGLVDRYEMVNLWQKQDVFISLSDFEGASLSLLEAMSNGVIPIVTMVSGTTEFIENGINGFLCSINNVNHFIKYIKHLDSNRGKLKQFGELAKTKIEKKCNKKDYMKYILDLTK